MVQNSIDTSRLVVFGDSLSDDGNLFRFTGEPAPPYWKGRFSNGPTYAEQLAKELGARLDDLAFGGATASTTSPFSDPLPVNLPEQIAAYLFQLHGHKARAGTTAVINIGSNDYINFLESGGSTTSTIPEVVCGVLSSIENAIDALTAAGVQKIALFTLPDLSVTPEVQDLAPMAPGLVTLAQDLIVANNTMLQELAAAHPNVELVDVFQLSEAGAADPLSFGFSDPNVPMTTLLMEGNSYYAPNEIAFFDTVHPTYAAHGVEAAFADAVLTSDHTQFLNGTELGVVQVPDGNSFIFATPSLNDNYTISGGTGNDLIFAGAGDVTVHGGKGNDLIAAGSGDAKLYGGLGTDVLATNSLQTNLLEGGEGNDALIANRGGSNTLKGGTGNDLFILKENASLVNLDDGTFNFGTQTIVGGDGSDTLRFIINNQNPCAEDALVAEFQKVETAFDVSIANHRTGTFQVDGLNVSGIDAIQLQIDGVSNNPNTPYLITHNIQFSQGHGAPVSNTLGSLLNTAQNWGLLTV
jgi:phospholipase/lecithinase/hemolysin